MGIESGTMSQPASLPRTYTRYAAWQHRRLRQFLLPFPSSPLDNSFINPIPRTRD
jgi:hypothetical protein